MSDNKGLWYFAHPYTCRDENGHYVPEGEEANFQLANYRSGRLLLLGYNVYSPISHTHPIHRATPEFLARHEHEAWYRLDMDLISRTRFTGIILAPGWENSKGCIEERKWFESREFPVLFYEDVIRGVKEEFDG